MDTNVISVVLHSTGLDTTPVESEFSELMAKPEGREWEGKVEGVETRGESKLASQQEILEKQRLQLEEYKKSYERLQEYSEKLQTEYAKLKAELISRPSTSTGESTKDVKTAGMFPCTLCTV